MREILLKLEGLTKAYPGVVANSGVDLAIQKGEVHALLGENGAGKSTLVKTIYGLVAPDAGHMTFEGKPFRPADPRAARAVGIAMVFQHFSLFEALTVVENIALGMEHPPTMRALATQIKAVSQTYGLPLDPQRIVGDLSAGERQRVEIIRCLLQDPKLLIMDEPTSVLTPQEVRILFATLRQLRAQGTAILYISHKLEEIRALCDQATILRLGKVVANCDPQQVSAKEMAEMMVGSALQAPKKQTVTEQGAVALTLSQLSAPAPQAFGTPLRDINLTVRSGEVLGIGGVAGNGQEELVAALSGEMRVAANMIQLYGQAVGALPPNARRKLGLCAAPEDRNGHAAAPDLSLTENALMTADARMGLSRHGFINRPQARSFASAVIKRFDVRTPSTDILARALSGGNLQKFVIGREILQAPKVFVVNQPTWGVDAAAAAAIRQAILDLAEAGAAVICISHDLDELMEISDRFAALNGGRLSPPSLTASLSLDQIGLMLGGAHDMEVAHVKA